VPAGRGPRAPRPGPFRHGSSVGMPGNACGWREYACRPAGPGQGACVELNKTRSPPCMRCRGPCLASPHRSASCLAFPRRAPPARVRNPREAQVSLLLPRPGVASGQCPFLTVKAFLLPRRRTAQAFCPSFSGYFAVHITIHRMWLVIRIRRQFSTALYTASPQVTRRNAGSTGSPGRPLGHPQEKFGWCQIRISASRFVLPE
jgi:hypothetical protein